MTEPKAGREPAKKRGRSRMLKGVWVVLASAVVLAVLVLVMAVALARLNGAYEQLTGQPPGERRLRWMRSMNTVREDPEIIGMRVSVLERVVVASVYLAVVTFLVWFFFFAKSPLPG